jgi:beta-glucosidase-like glycosyl hydrolase
MGGVLAAGSIEHVAVEHIRAGGDLCLVCHQEDLITRAYEALVREAERDRKFARRVRESHQRVLQLKKKVKPFKHGGPAPGSEQVAKLTRQLWEFSEQVRLASIKRKERE